MSAALTDSDVVWKLASDGDYHQLIPALKSLSSAPGFSINAYHRDTRWTLLYTVVSAAVTAVSATRFKSYFYCIRFLCESMSADMTVGHERTRESAVHLAASQGSSKVLEYFVVTQRGPLSTVDVEGRTAEDVASANGQEACVLLLRAEANRRLGIAPAAAPSQPGLSGGTSAPSEHSLADRRVATKATTQNNIPRGSGNRHVDPFKKPQPAADWDGISLSSAILPLGTHEAAGPCAIEEGSLSAGPPSTTEFPISRGAVVLKPQGSPNTYEFSLGSPPSLPLTARTDRDPATESPVISVSRRPVCSLTIFLADLYTSLQKRVVEEKRLGSEKTYNGGYDDQDGHYRDIVGETILDRYVVSKKLGSGTFGKVLCCYDMKQKMTVALKVTRAGRTFREQAKLEANVILSLNRLSRVNQLAVRLLKVFDWMGHMVLSFEILSYSLLQALKMTELRGLSLDFIRSAASQILQVLREMDNHKPHPIVHSDIKPENVLLRSGRDHRVALIDFGSACYVGHCLQKYIQSRFYRSPEVILHLPYSTAIDRWSLGCMIVELYTGVPLFFGRDEKEQIYLFESTLGPIPADMLQQSLRTQAFYSLGSAGYELLEEKRKRRSISSIIMNRHPTRSPEDVEECQQLIDLVTQLLAYRPSERISCEAALQHSFFTDFNGPLSPRLNT